MALAAGLGSSLLTPAYSAIAQDFGIDRDLTVLNTSLYVYVPQFIVLQNSLTLEL
jgi:hypothetical protein